MLRFFFFISLSIYFTVMTAMNILYERNQKLLELSSDTAIKTLSELTAYKISTKY